MRVVTIAITTMMENNCGVMRRRSSPMLRMISSMRPRAFMRVPTARAVGLSSPCNRAAAQHARNLPAHAATSAMPATTHSSGVATRSSRVFRPE